MPCPVLRQTQRELFLCLVAIDPVLRRTAVRRDATLGGESTIIAERLHSPRSDLLCTSHDAVRLVLRGPTSREDEMHVLQTAVKPLTTQGSDLEVKKAE